MIGLVVTNLLTALIPPIHGWFSLGLALIINFAILYFVFKIESAPNEFFLFILIAYAFTLIFNGLKTITLLSGSDPTPLKNISQAAAFVYTLIITPDMWKFYQSIQASKAQAKA